MGAEVEVEHTLFIGYLLNLHLDLLIEVLDILPSGFRMHLEDVNHHSLIL